jgi:xanthine dehydrogenase molybdopterin-binding subunit B
MHIKLSTTEHVKSHHFSLSPSNLLLFPFTACYAAATSHSMAGEADQTPHVTDEPIINENKSDFETESNIPTTSSSSNAAAAKMAEKIIPEMVDYWKKTTITEAD